MPECDFVFVSSGAFRSRSIQEIVWTAIQADLHCLEMGSGTDWTPTLLEPIQQTLGNPIRYLLHNYFPPHERSFVLNLASDDQVVLACSMEHCRQAIRLSAEFGAPFFSVHAGFAFSAKPEELGRDLTAAPRIALDEAHRIFIQSLRDLCQFAEGLGVRLLVENNVIARFNLIGGRNCLGLCTNAEEVLQTFAEVDSPALGFLVDVGHLKVTAATLSFDAHDFLDRIGPHVGAFHLSDNDGMEDQNLPFGDDAWFLPRLNEFPKATMILEAYRLDHEQIRSCCETIKRARHRPRAM